MFVFSNLATSLDGKIGTQQRKCTPLGTKTDWHLMLELRNQCDAILIGATTLKTFRKPCLALHKSHRPINIVMSSKLQGISEKWPYFTKKGQRILIVGPSAPAERIKKFEKSCEIMILRKSSPKAPLAQQILTGLKKQGIRRLLIEGGGEIMWNFVQQNLIDEYHVTLTPRLLGGREAPTLVDGEGFKPTQIVNVKLSQCQVLRDELYLIYRKTSKRGLT